MGKHGKPSFMVIEFLDGVTLKYKIGNRPLDLETLVPLSTEIADALDALTARYARVDGNFIVMHAARTAVM
jgi:hypothetical protein